MKTNPAPLTTPTAAVLLAAVMCFATPVRAQVSLGADYTQDFNALGSTSGAWIDNATLPGWYTAVYTATSGTVAPYTTAYAVSAGGSVSSTTLYAFGIGGSSERALGGAASTTNLGLLGLRTVNDTGTPIQAVSVSYDGEQWRRDITAVARISVSYHLFAPGTGSLSVLDGWVEVPQLTFSSPVTGATVGTGSLDGNVAANRVADIHADLETLDLQPNHELWLKWTVSKVNGNNLGQGVDNVRVSLVPEPGTAALLLFGLLAFRARSRRATPAA
jgi:hypothetical protein